MRASLEIYDLIIATTTDADKVTINHDDVNKDARLGVLPRAHYSRLDHMRAPGCAGRLSFVATLVGDADDKRELDEFDAEVDQIHPIEGKSPGG